MMRPVVESKVIQSSSIRRLFTPETHDPKAMEEFEEIDHALDSLESNLRWIPGGSYRFEADERGFTEGGGK